MLPKDGKTIVVSYFKVWTGDFILWMKNWRVKCYRVGIKWIGIRQSYIDIETLCSRGENNIKSDRDSTVFRICIGFNWMRTMQFEYENEAVKMCECVVKCGQPKRRSDWLFIIYIDGRSCRMHLLIGPIENTYSTQNLIIASSVEFGVARKIGRGPHIKRIWSAFVALHGLSVSPHKPATHAISLISRLVLPKDPLCPVDRYLLAIVFDEPVCAANRPLYRVHNYC